MKGANARRRAFLKGVAIASVSAAAVGVGTFYFARDAARKWWLGPNPDAAAQELTPATLRALMAVTEAVTATRIEPVHYEDYFRWHARTLPGYKQLYDRVVALLNREASARGYRVFADCVHAVRVEILSRLDDSRDNRARRW